MGPTIDLLRQIGEFGFMIHARSLEGQENFNDGLPVPQENSLRCGFWFPSMNYGEWQSGRNRGWKCRQHSGYGMVTEATRGIEHGTWDAPGDETSADQRKKTRRQTALRDGIVKRPSDGNCKAG